MRLFGLCTLVLSTLAGLVVAAENPIIFPEAGTVVPAGSSIQVTWNPTTSGNIKLILRYGAKANLNTGATVASNIPNSGSFIWNVPNNIGNGEWAIAIYDGKDADTNYSAMFTITGGSGKQGSAGSTTAAANPTASVISGGKSGATATNGLSGTGTGSQSPANTGAAMKLGSAGGLAAAVGLGALAVIA